MRREEKRGEERRREEERGEERRREEKRGESQSSPANERGGSEGPVRGAERLSERVRGQAQARPACVGQDIVCWGSLNFEMVESTWKWKGLKDCGARGREGGGGGAATYLTLLERLLPVGLALVVVRLVGAASKGGVKEEGRTTGRMNKPSKHISIVVRLVCAASELGTRAGGGLSE